jgi:two-component system NtrC family sensor kinase
VSSLFRGIGWRIFLSFSTLIIVVVLFLSFVALKFAQNTVTSNASNELRVFSVTLSGQLQRYMKRIETGMKSLSAAQGVLDNELRSEHANRKRIDKFLTIKLSQLNVFEALGVIDTSGNCIAATDPDWVDTPAQREPFFASGLRHFSFAEIFESPESDEKVLMASTPINEGSDPHGVLVGKVKLSSIYDLMGQQLPLEGNVEAFVLDSELRFITPAKNAPDELLESHLIDTPLVQHLQDEFWVGRYHNYKGDEVLGTVLKIPGTRWYLVIEREFADVEKQLSGVKRVLFIATLIMLSALLLLTIFLTASITRPLKSLVESAQRIASGDLSKSVAIPARSDELTFLATEFDRMRAKLAASQGRLIEQLEESEQKRIENERLAAIGTLASSLAHEIRNPLNAVSLLLSQLERSRGSDTEVLRLRSIESMRAEIARLDRLVSDILDYARPLQLQKEKIDFNIFMQELLEFYRATFDAGKIIVKFQVPEKPLMIVVDKDKLKQACVNVVQNAIEAMPDGGELEVGIDISFHNGVHFFIKDSGVGLKEDSKSRLFDLFFTTKGMGTGLGLGNVRKIIEAHGGSVAINSTQPKGATVSIYLPSGVLNSQT